LTLLRRHLCAATLAAFLCAAGFSFAVPPVAAAAPGISDIRAWTNEIYTRVAIDTP